MVICIHTFLFFWKEYQYFSLHSPKGSYTLFLKLLWHLLFITEGPAIMVFFGEALKHRTLALGGHLKSLYCTVYSLHKSKLRPGARKEQGEVYVAT